jgi:AcrR family transcriptional regulator
MSVRKARRKNLPAADRREQILEAALRAFSRGGYHGTHVSHVVAEAGVARGTFYLHFRSKHEVFGALVERMLALFLEARPEGVERQVHTAADAEQVLRQSYAAVLGTFQRHRRLARLLFEEAIGVDKGFTELLESHYAIWHARVARMLETLIERGVARRDLDVELGAEMVIGMVERVARRFVFARDDVPLERLVDALARFELSGVGEVPVTPGA